VALFDTTLACLSFHLCPRGGKHNVASPVAGTPGISPGLCITTGKEHQLWGKEIGELAAGC
jgi:hypothetical protein